MATTDVLKSATPYLGRLLEDERVHEQLSDAAGALSRAYRRARRLPAAEAAEDKKLYDHLRHAVGSLRGAANVIRRKPAPKPKRRGRRLLVVAGVGACAALLVSERARAKARTLVPSTPAQDPPPQHEPVGAEQREAALRPIH
jgi:hypothetical protein